MNLIFNGLKAIGFAALIALPMSAASARDLVGRLDEAWKDAIEDQEGVLTPKQTTILHDTAYQAAVARVCDGINIDQAKYAKAVNDLLADTGDKFEDEAEIMRSAHTLVMLGTSYGLFLAEGNIDRDKFCLAATETKADMSMPNLWQ